MTDAIANFIYGAVGGGLVAAGLRIVETYFIAPHLTELAESRKKSLLYGKPLWRACHDLHYRLVHIKQKMHSPRNSLSGSLKEAKSLEWFTTKEGNYLTSTAYMIAAVAAWIALYERDTVFLQFEKESLTTQFLLKVEKFKSSISNKNILWFHYVSGIGEQLIQDGASRPISFSNFCHQLLKDEDFKAYYSQLFQFLNQVNQGEFEKSIEDTLYALSEIKLFLVSKDIVMDMPREFGPS